MMNIGRCVTVILLLAIVSTAVGAAPRAASWAFVVSGDSRNCGDVVMPSIAAAAHASHARFYWHLGDLRFIRDFDQDYRQLNPKATIAEYLADAWSEAQRNQLEPFGDVPVFLAIGNHEVIPPKSREAFALSFADWLDAPAIREQRLRDDPHDHHVRTYFHWSIDGIDFVSLDNASPEQFDAGQLQWLNGVLERDRRDREVRAVVVGMHGALPDSLAHSHSMDDELIEQATGRQLYAQLLEMRSSKPVYILASHLHLVMEGVFDTPYWREHGGVVPGWIIGSAGAVRYALPPGAQQAKLARTHVYGYLLATVQPRGANDRDPIGFEFREVSAAAVPPAVVERFGETLVRWCYEQNVQY